jgi:hypothetical protein
VQLSFKSKAIEVEAPSCSSKLSFEVAIKVPYDVNKQQISWKKADLNVGILMLPKGNKLAEKMFQRS